MPPSKLCTGLESFPDYEPAFEEDDDPEPDSPPVEEPVAEEPVDPW